MTEDTILRGKPRADEARSKYNSGASTFDIDPINFDDIYDLIDYDKSGKNDEDASEASKTARDNMLKYGIFEDGSDTYAQHNLPVAPPIPQHSNDTKSTGLAVITTRKSSAESIIPASPVKSHNVRGWHMKHTTGQTISNVIGTSIQSHSPVVSRHSVSNSPSLGRNRIVSDSRSGTLDIMKGEELAGSHVIMRVVNSPKDQTEQIVRNRICSWEQDLKPNVSPEMLPKGAIALPHLTMKNAPAQETFSGHDDNRERKRYFTGHADQQNSNHQLISRATKSAHFSLNYQNIDSEAEENRPDLATEYNGQNIHHQASSPERVRRISSPTGYAPTPITKISFTKHAEQQVSQRRSSERTKYPQSPTSHAMMTSYAIDSREEAFKRRGRSPRRGTVSPTPMDQILMNHAQGRQQVIEDATSSNAKLMALKTNTSVPQIPGDAVPSTSAEGADRKNSTSSASQARTAAQRSESQHGQTSSSSQSSPGATHSVDSGNSSGKALDLSTNSSNSSPNGSGASTTSSERADAGTLRPGDDPARYQRPPPLQNATAADANAVEVTGYRNDLEEIISVDLVRQARDSWYRPNMSRDLAINTLKTAPFGSFLIRDSTSFTGGFGLALRVERLTDKILKNVKNGADMMAEHVRHYLIETIGMGNGKCGYQLKGSLDEPIYTSLDMLVFKHILQPISLPLTLNLSFHVQSLPNNYSPSTIKKRSEKSNSTKPASHTKTESTSIASTSRPKLAPKSVPAQQEIRQASPARHHQQPTSASSSFKQTRSSSNNSRVTQTPEPHHNLTFRPQQAQPATKSPSRRVVMDGTYSRAPDHRMRDPMQNMVTTKSANKVDQSFQRMQVSSGPNSGGPSPVAGPLPPKTVTSRSFKIDRQEEQSRRVEASQTHDFRTALRTPHDSRSASQTRIPDTRSASVTSQRSPVKNVNFAPDTSFERTASVNSSQNQQEVSLTSINSINASRLGTLDSNGSRSHHPIPGLGSSVGRVSSTQALYSCKLIYLGCRDCEKLVGAAAVDRSIARLLGAKTPNSSLVDFKIQRSGVTLTDINRKLFFRKHFNKKQLLTCDIDPKSRTINATQFGGQLEKAAHIFGVVVRASGSQNQCHILVEADPSCSTAVIVAKLKDFTEDCLN